MKTLSIVLKSAVIALAILGILGLVGRSIAPRPNALGNAVQGNECYSTTTPQGFSSNTLLRTGPGTLCSVVLTGQNTGNFALYDATTTNVNKRTGNTATSSIYLGQWPANATSSTYAEDIIFNTGLLFDGSGSVPTTTISWR